MGEDEFCDAWINDLGLNAFCAWKVPRIEWSRRMKVTKTTPSIAQTKLWTKEMVKTIRTSFAECEPHIEAATADTMHQNFGCHDDGRNVVIFERWIRPSYYYRAMESKWMKRFFVPLGSRRIELNFTFQVGESFINATVLFSLFPREFQ